jgi:hypothetical protein
MSAPLCGVGILDRQNENWSLLAGEFFNPSNALDGMPLKLPLRAPRWRDKMTKSYAVGEHVKWRWGPNWARGKITERFTERVTRKIKDKEITRNANDENPAYMVQQTDGGRALKTHRPLHKE